jgi:hypothetical protein
MLHIIAIKIKYSKIHGYVPNDSEILYLYQCGELILTDRQENELIKYFNL